MLVRVSFWDKHGTRMCLHLVSDDWRTVSLDRLFYSIGSFFSAPIPYGRFKVYSDGDLRPAVKESDLDGPVSWYDREVIDACLDISHSRLVGPFPFWESFSLWDHLFHVDASGSMSLDGWGAVDEFQRTKIAVIGLYRLLVDNQFGFSTLARSVRIAEGGAINFAEWSYPAIRKSAKFPYSIKLEHLVGYYLWCLYVGNYAMTRMGNIVVQLCATACNFTPQLEFAPIERSIHNLVGNRQVSPQQCIDKNPYSDPVQEYMIGSYLRHVRSNVISHTSSISTKVMGNRYLISVASPYPNVIVQGFKGSSNLFFCFQNGDHVFPLGHYSILFPTRDGSMCPISTGYFLGLKVFDDFCGKWQHARACSTKRAGKIVIKCRSCDLPLVDSLYSEICEYFPREVGRCFHLHTRHLHAGHSLSTPYGVFDWVGDSSPWVFGSVEWMKDTCYINHGRDHSMVPSLRVFAPDKGYFCNTCLVFKHPADKGGCLGHVWDGVGMHPRPINTNTVRFSQKVFAQYMGSRNTPRPRKGAYSLLRDPRKCVPTFGHRVPRSLMGSVCKQLSFRKVGETPVPFSKTILDMYMDWHDPMFSTAVANTFTAF